MLGLTQGFCDDLRDRDRRGAPSLVSPNELRGKALLTLTTERIENGTRTETGTHKGVTN